MSLTGRLSAFFLVALGLALAGSGIAVYALTASYFARRADERLTAALDTLSSAAEVKSNGIEWEPNERNLTLGRDNGEDQVRWTVHDRDGQLIAVSPNLGDADLGDAGQWQSRTRQVMSPTPVRARVGDANSRRFKRYAELVLTAGISPLPDQAQLSRLARVLIAVGCGAWLVAAFAGRWLCWRALAPVRRMATAAASMNATDLDRRLEAAGTGDELEELGSAFNGLLGRLEAAFERQRRFTGDAAHQLSTPLTALLGHLEVTLRRDRSTADYRAATEEAHARAIHLRQIVEALLFLARPEVDASPPAKETIDLGPWLVGHVAGWQGHVRASDIQLDTTGCETLKIAVAPALLAQLLDNLLDNACKYSPPGTPISVLAQPTADGAQISVRDSGIGIGKEDLPHVFDAFYRSPSARRAGQQGVGLGLAVARRIAGVLGGAIAVNSELGQGSSFVLRLPGGAETQRELAPAVYS
jgi:heavy metal sensor kinase